MPLEMEFLQACFHLLLNKRQRLSTYKTQPEKFSLVSSYVSIKDNKLKLFKLSKTSEYKKSACSNGSNGLWLLRSCVPWSDIFKISRIVGRLEVSCLV